MRDGGSHQSVSRGSARLSATKTQNADSDSHANDSIDRRDSDAPGESENPKIEKIEKISKSISGPFLHYTDMNFY